MQQVVMTEPGKIELRDVPRPEPGDGDVLIKMKNIGVCGSDIHVFHGIHPYTPYPVIQGHEVSGQIAEVLADFNDRVEKDQVLARLDPQTYTARVREAEAELEVARAEALSRDAALTRAIALKEQKTARRRVQEEHTAGPLPPDRS